MLVSGMDTLIGVDCSYVHFIYVGGRGGPSGARGLDVRSTEGGEVGRDPRAWLALHALWTPLSQPTARREDGRGRAMSMPTRGRARNGGAAARAWPRWPAERVLGAAVCAAGQRGR
jgi:hypothetical protein